MKEYSVAVGTVTNALKAKDLLKGKKIYVSVERMKHGSENYGCGYAVLIKTMNIENVINYLKDNKIRILAVNEVI